MRDSATRPSAAPVMLRTTCHRFLAALVPAAMMCVCHDMIIEARQGNREDYVAPITLGLHFIDGRLFQSRTAST